MAGLIQMLPYLDEYTPPSDYLPTKRAQYKVFHNDGVATVTIDQNEGGFTSLGVFVFDSTARVELSSNGVEFLHVYNCINCLESESRAALGLDAL
jgi:hypothetical protein